MIRRLAYYWYELKQLLGRGKRREYARGYEAGNRDAMALHQLLLEPYEEEA